MRAEVTAAGQAQKTVQTGELSMRQQLAAVASLQRQRSAALVSQWKQEQNAVTGLKSHIAQLTNTMQALGSSSAILQGPLGGVAGRLSSVGALATEAGGGLGIATAGAAALLVGVGALAVGIFKLTEATAEFQGQMFDLSQQTGVSVETLSTLDAVARTTGGDISAISQSLGVFQSHLENAQDPTSKEAKLLKDLGVESNNTEEAFRQTLTALSKLPEGFQQTADARDLFGGRGAKALLAILKETNGDLDGATERLRAMGILITGPAAQAADQFNDRLEETKLQIRGLAAIIGNEAMPTISEAIKDASKFITDNREIIVGWTHDVGDAAKGAAWLATKIAEIGNQLTGLANIPTPLVLRFLSALDPTGLSSIAQGLKALGTPTDIPALPSNGALTPIPVRPSNAPSGTRAKGGGGRAKSQTDEIYAAEIAASQAAADKEIEIQRHLAESLKLTYDENHATLEEYYKGQQTLADAHFNTLIDEINREQAALDEARARKLIKAKEADKKEADLVQRTSEAQNEFTEETRKIALQKQQALDKAELDLNKQLKQIQDTIREGELDKIEDQLKRGLITEAEAIKRKQELYKQEYDERVLLLNLELRQLSTNAARKVAINNELIEADTRYTDKFTQLTKDRIDAIMEEAHQAEQAHIEELERRTRESQENEDPGRIGKIIEGQLGPPPAAFDGWLMLKNVALDAIQGIAQGVGQMAQAWVLYGNAGPNAMKKMVASVLAGVAAQAAVNAVMELAYGIAALTPWGAAIYGPAPLHFKSAALFGSIALVAGLAGRAIAGDAFNQSTGGAAAGGGGRTTPTKPPGITADRRSGLQSGNQQVEVILKLSGGLEQVIEGHVVNNWNKNGRIRTVVQTDGQV
jgi:hypothetical protein